MDALLEDMIDRLSKNEEIELPQLPKESLENLYEEAYNYYEAGKYQHSIDHFRLLTLFDGQNSLYWIGLGACHQMQRQFEQALENYRIALMLDQDNPYICVHASECYFGLDEVKQGLEALKYAEALAKHKSDQYQPLISQLALIRERWSNRGHK